MHTTHTEVYLYSLIPRRQFYTLSQSSPYSKMHIPGPPLQWSKTWNMLNTIC